MYAFVRFKFFRRPRVRQLAEALAGEPPLNFDLTRLEDKRKLALLYDMGFRGWRVEPAPVVPHANKVTVEVTVILQNQNFLYAAGEKCAATRARRATPPQRHRH